MYIDEIFISDIYKLSDYLDLEFNKESPEEVWKKVIDIFVDRLQGRYFNAINKLSDNGNKIEMQKYGFSIMSIECLLIDTLVKFRYGPVPSKKGTLSYNFENQKQFTKFLREIWGNYFNEEKALKFYKDIRCGIIHFGTTKNNSRLTCDSKFLITELEDGSISVDIYILEQKLEQYFKQYVAEISDKNQEVLRKNFILAMNRICNIY